MAQSRKSNNTTRKSNSSKSKSSQNKSSSSSSNKSTNRSASRSNNRNSSTSKNTVRNAEVEAPSFLDYWHAFTKTRVFKPIATVSIVVLVVLLDMLFAWNHFDRFFMILGIELLIISIAWVIGLIFNISIDHSNEIPNQDKE